jgi:monoamine oxidase
MASHQDDRANTRGVSRREFIKAGGAAVGGMALAGSPSAATRKDVSTRPVYDAIVLGGGFAGVTAARELKQKGYSTLLLESRHRLGGRTLTVRMGEHHFEFGGFWVHWTQPYVWAEINRYNLAVDETPGSVPDRFFFSIDGSPFEMPASELMSGNNAFEKLFGDARVIWERPYDQNYNWEALAAADKRSVAEVMEAKGFTDEEKMELDGIVGVMAHTTSDKASYVEIARWYAAAAFHYDTLAAATGRYTIRDGTIALIDAMIEDSNPNIELNAVVKSVKQDADSVTVQTADGKTFRCKTLVNTLPMNAVGEVMFDPPLSNLKMAGYREKHAGEGLKTYMEIEGQWGKLAGLDSSSSPLSFIMTYKELLDSTIILGFGSDGSNFDPNDKGKAQQALQRILPEVRVISATGYNWVQDPFAQGTWCTYRPGQLARFGTEMTRSEGRVFMGSGDHGEGWRGFIDGAIGRGIRVADEVDKFLG